MAPSPWSPATNPKRKAARRGAPAGDRALDRGIAHYNAGRFSSALKDFRQSLAASPGPTAAMFAAHSLMALARRRQAVRALGLLLGRWPAYGPGSDTLKVWEAPVAPSRAGERAASPSTG